MNIAGIGLAVVTLRASSPTSAFLGGGGLVLRDKEIRSWKSRKRWRGR
jgi:hypothetical protein